MRIEQLINELQKLKSEYGNLEVVDGYDHDLMDVIVQKYIMTNSDHNSIISRQTEDLDENYLEEMYVDGDYKEHFVSKGVCIKIY